MYAKVLTVQIQPGKLDETIDEYRKYDRSWQQQKGFQGATVHVDRGAHKAVSINYWDTRADLEALEASEWHKQATTELFKRVLAAPPVRDVYEVAHQIRPEQEVAARDRGHTTYARILTAQVQPGKIDEMIDNYHKYDRSFQGQKGFQGLTLHVDRSANKMLSITNWETRADLEALDTSGWYREANTDPFRILVAGSLAREIYEVAHYVEPAREAGAA